MRSGMSPYVTAGVALVGASLIAVTPIAPQASASSPEHRAVAMDVSLAAATCVTTDGAVCGGADAPATYPAITANNVFNIPVNLFNAIVSIPAAEVAGMNLLAKSLEDTGSLLVWSPTNVFGFDQADPDKLRAIYNLLIPFPALSSVIGEQAVVWAQANFPVNPGCAALPGACPDPAAILSETLKVPTSQLYSGYTFPTKVNPFDGSSVGYPDGYVQLDPDAPGKAFLASLVAPPTGPQTVTLAEVGASFARLGAALFNSFYPFVQNSEYYNPDQTGLAYVFRALSPILCGNCNRDPADGYAGVYQPDYLYDNYDPHYPPGQGPATVAMTAIAKTASAKTADSETAASETTARDGRCQDGRFGCRRVGRSDERGNDAKRHRYRRLVAGSGQGSDVAQCRGSSGRGRDDAGARCDDEGRRDDEGLCARASGEEGQLQGNARAGRSQAPQVRWRTGGCDEVSARQLQRLQGRHQEGRGRHEAQRQRQRRRRRDRLSRFREVVASPFRPRPGRNGLNSAESIALQGTWRRNGHLRN